MTPQIEVTDAMAGATQLSKQTNAKTAARKPTVADYGKRTPANKGKPKVDLEMERDLIAAMHSSDMVLEGLPEEQRDPLIRELIKTYEGTRKPTADLNLERDLTAARCSADMVLERLPEEKRDAFRRELIKTFEAML